MLTETTQIPYFDISIPAGFPSPAEDYREEVINLNDHLIQHPVSTFYVKCTGYSMIEAFIPPTAHLLVDRSIKPKNGDIVLAYINGGFTVKYLQVNALKSKLIPANKKFQPIEIGDDTECVIWGVVTKIIIDPKDCKHVCFG